MALDAIASGRWPVAAVVAYSGRLASPRPTGLLSPDVRVEPVSVGWGPTASRLQSDDQGILASCSRALRKPIYGQSVRL